MVRVWSQAIAPTSVGTAVAETILNGGVDFSVTQKVRGLIEIFMESISTGALTAAESLMLRTILTSGALTSMGTKEWVASYASGGLGAFLIADHPVLKAMPLNVVFPGATTPITISGQAQIANTVAPEMGAEFTFTDGGVLGPEQFYIAPDNETNTGTAAAAADGNDITINGAYMINQVGIVVTPGVTTASESQHGRAQITSQNFDGVPSPQTFYAQPIAVAPGSAIGVVTSNRWKKVEIPIGNTFLAQTAYLMDEAQTATGNYIVQVGYLKRQMAAVR